MRRLNLATAFVGDRLLWMLVAACLVVLVMIPLAVSIDTAFRQESRFGLADRHALTAFINVYTSPDYLSALAQTLLMSAAVTLISVPVGAGFALLMARTDLPWKSTLEFLIVMPLFLSPFTGLMAWIALGSAKTGFLNSAWFALAPASSTPLIDIWTWAGAVWVMFLFFMPFIYLFSVSGMRSMDGSLEESARSVGATPLRALAIVTLPLSAPSILIAALVVFVLTAETYTVPGTIGNFAGFNVLSWQIFLDETGSSLRQAHAASAGTMLLIVAALGLGLQRWLTRKSSRFVTVTGKGFQGRLLVLGQWRWAALAAIGGYVLCATVLPFAALILNSFLTRSSAVITPDLFTSQHYRQFFGSSEMLNALLNTIGLAVGAGLICVAFGLVVSYADVRRPGLLPKIVAVVSALPVAVPGLIYAIGLLWLFLKTPLYGTIWVLLMVYVAKFVPFGIVMTRGGLQQIHPDLENAARMSGATGIQSVRLVTLPLLRATLVSALFCIMLLCIKELSASAMLYTNRSEVLSVLAWHYMDSGNYQFAAALGVIQSLIMVGMVLLTRWLFGIRLERAMGRSAA